MSDPKYLHEQIMLLHGKEDLFSRLKREVLVRKLVRRKPENGGSPDLEGALMEEALNEIFNLRGDVERLTDKVERLVYRADWDGKEGYYR